MSANTNLNESIMNVTVRKSPIINDNDYLVYDIEHMAKAMRLLSYNGLKIYLYILSIQNNRLDLNMKDINDKMKLSKNEVLEGINNLINNRYLTQCNNNYRFNEAGK